ncbi:MAG TPA: hypothetical protein VJ184_05390 [Chryseolinea sp.]|nr:hypothetical protein [Chryseolinea sp.]
MVEELGLDPGVDTLARWMAHYVAEQIAIAENATGDAKTKAEQRCFETILKLWQHRSSLPTGHRPFESFEPIFRALERLDPENTTPYFYSGQNSSEKGESGENSDDVQMWLGIARGIDQAARVWLEYVFHQAALSATDENTITWLENAVGRPGSEETSIIVRLIESGQEDIEETAEQERQAKREKLKSRIKQLDAFKELNKILRAAFVTELKTMKQKDSSEDDKLETDLK